MRTFISAIGRLLTAAVFASAATGESVNLKWDPAVGGNRAFYRVYLGNEPGAYRPVLETPWEQARLSGLNGGQTYYVSVRSVNSAGIESDGSPEIRVDLPSNPFALAVTISSEGQTSWRDLIAPATLKIKALVGVTLSEVDRIDIAIVYNKPDGSKESFLKVLREPPFETEIADIGGASAFFFNPIMTLKNGEWFHGNVNEGEGLNVRVLPRNPKHQLRATWGKSALWTSTPVNLELQVDDIGMPVRKVVFMNGNVIIGEDTTSPYSIEWKNAAEGFMNVTAQVFYHGLEQEAFAPSNTVGLHYSKPPTTMNLSASGYAGGKFVVRGEVVNNEGFQIVRVQFLDGDRIVGEDSEPPYEFAVQTSAGMVHQMRGRAIFSTGHVLASEPVMVDIAAIMPAPTVLLQVPESPEPRTAPATIEMEALVTANGNLIQKVQFLAGGEVLGEDGDAPYGYTWAGVSARSTTVSARVFYGEGGMIETAPVAVVIRNAKPTSELSIPVPPGGWVAPAAVGMDVAVTANGNPIQKVQFLAGGEVLGEDGDAPYGYTWAGVSARSTTVSARVFYGEGGMIETAPVAVVIRNAKPTAELSIPVPPGGWVAPAAVGMDVAVTANGNLIQKVQFLAGGEVLGEDGDAPYGYTWAGVSARSTTVLARVFYGEGGMVETAPVAVVIGNAKPTAELSIPVPPGGWVAPAAVGMDVAVNANGNPIQKVQFLAGGEVLGEDGDAPYGYTWAGVSARSTTVLARVFYGEGGMVETAPVAVVIGNAKPTAELSITVPPGGWVAPAAVGMDVAVNANGNPIQKVQFLAGGRLLGEDASAPYGFTWVGVSARSTTVSARVFYGEGGMIETAPVAVVIRNTKPTAVLSIPVPPGGWVAPAAVGMDVAVNANGNPIQKVQFLAGGEVLGEDASAPYGFTWVGVSARSTTVSARVFYGEGRMIETAPVAVVVKPGQPPSVALEVRDDGSDFRAPARLVLSARLESHGHAIENVLFLSGGVPVREVAEPPFEADWETVSPGPKRIVARVVYGGGLIVDSSPVDINIASALPSPWRTRDIGVVPVPGFAEAAGGKPLSFVLSSNGILQAGRLTDSFRFVFQPLAGNGEIEAEVSAAGAEDGSEIVGLMIRENLNDSSPYVFVGVGATPFLYRDRSGSVSSTIPTLPVKARRIGIKRMVKAGGDTILLRYFDETPPNGTPRWVNFRNVPGGMVLPKTVYVGFVVASSNPVWAATGLITEPLVHQ